jgi:hypothetical protein
MAKKTSYQGQMEFDLHLHRQHLDCHVVGEMSSLTDCLLVSSDAEFEGANAGKISFWGRKYSTAWSISALHSSIMVVDQNERDGAVFFRASNFLLWMSAISCQVCASLSKFFSAFGGGKVANEKIDLNLGRLT